MKIKEMAETCKKNKNNCKQCPLYCIDEWENEYTWCLMQLKLSYIKAYKDYKEEKNDILAERVKIRYEEIEKKYIKES